MNTRMNAHRFKHCKILQYTVNQQEFALRNCLFVTVSVCYSGSLSRFSTYTYVIIFISPYLSFLFINFFVTTHFVIFLQYLVISFMYS
jgi:hypothetical protein